MTNDVKISVIVPVYNTRAYLARCIEALKAQEYDSGRYELIFVDNNSTDGSRAVLDRTVGVRCLREPKQGSYSARNTGVREAKGEILAFTDSDCIPDLGWLRAIDQAFRSPQTQIVQGSRRPERSRGMMRLLSDYENNKDQLIFSSADPEVYYGYTNNMAVRRSTFDVYGPFLERMRGSDTLFILSAVRSEGCQAMVYVPEMCVRHGEITSAAAYCKKMFIYGRCHLVKTRSISVQDRALAFRRATQGKRWPAIQRFLLATLLAAGMVAWQVGEWLRPRGL